VTNPSELTATEARRLIGERKLSPVELLEACIERTEAVNPAVNAVVTKAYDLARVEAKAAEEACMSGKNLGLLHGLPSLIKDLNDTTGIRTTYGSPLYRNHVPTSDDPIVARMRRQGAVIFGKTNSPEFGVGSNTTNRVFGPTGNPFDPTRTCGGSSGGAGVALATGMAPIANGSDSGASIRNPSAFCGVTGLRPTPGLVASDKRVIGLSTNGVQGPMGRTVADNALLLAAIAAYDNRDMLSRPIDPSTFLALKPVDVSGLRVALSEDLGFAPVDQIVRRTFRQKLGAFSHAFAVCEDCDVGMQNAEMAYWGMRGLYFLAGSKKRYDEHRDNLDPNLCWNIEDALASSSADMAAALAEQTRTYQNFQSVFDRYDVLITPAVNVLPFPHRTAYPETLDGRPARHYSEWYSITYGISLVGHPAIAIPAGLDSQGTPFGLQVVGARFGDHCLLEIAQALESVLAAHAETRRPLPDIGALTKAPRLEQAIAAE
jgi:Asp-tRNA(Asn)/Glu-tRNA(Gln) amidotransferase A subunit family amidase